MLVKASSARNNGKLINNIEIMENMREFTPVKLYRKIYVVFTLHRSTIWNCGKKYMLSNIANF